MKQTAVEWLVNELPKGDYNDKEKAIKKAKKMEKEQIKDAWINSLTKGDYNSADEYYNETFKLKKQSYQNKMKQTGK